MQELLDKNIAFKKEADRLIEQAEQQIYAPVHAKTKKKTIAKNGTKKVVTLLF